MSKATTTPTVHVRISGATLSASGYAPFDLGDPVAFRLIGRVTRVSDSESGRTVTVDDLRLQDGDQGDDSTRLILSIEGNGYPDVPEGVGLELGESVALSVAGTVKDVTRGLSTVYDTPYRAITVGAAVVSLGEPQEAAQEPQEPEDDPNDLAARAEVLAGQLRAAADLSQTNAARQKRRQARRWKVAGVAIVAVSSLAIYGGLLSFLASVGVR